MSRLYLYKLRYIDGTAPCDQYGLLSLAICKPAIRRTAQPGDLIFGVSATTCIPDNRLVYVARVDAAVSGREYYGGDRFAGRCDRIYAPQDAGFELRPGIGFHTSEAAKKRDLGDAPDWGNARVLVCKEYSYFGKEGSSAYKTEFPRVARLVSGLTQGHRVNHGDDIRAELLALRQWALQRRPTPARTQQHGLAPASCRT